MIISLENLKRPDEYKEVIELLGENGILPKKFAKHLAPIAGFRNILVHKYGDVDIAELHTHLKDVDDFKKFASYVAKHLEKNY